MQRPLTTWLATSELNARTGRDELIVEIARIDPKELTKEPDSKASANFQPDVAKYPFNITYATAGVFHRLPARLESESVFVEQMPYGAADTGTYSRWLRYCGNFKARGSTGTVISASASAAGT